MAVPSESIKMESWSWDEIRGSRITFKKQICVKKSLVKRCCIAFATCLFWLCSILLTYLIIRHLWLNNLIWTKNNVIPMENINHHQPWLLYRLPNDVLPMQYNISLYPNFYGDKETHVFEGNVTISMDVIQSTKFVLIHKRDLTIHEFELRHSDNNSLINIKSSFYHNETQTWVIETQEKLSVNSRLLYFLSFSGIIKEKGIHVSSFTDTTTDNSKQKIVYTKFEPAYARNVFPCFDEPLFKASFIINIVHRNTHVVLSNMPTESSEPFVLKTSNSDSLIITHFPKTTIKMSTYLVAFVIMESYMNKSFGPLNRPVRIFAPKYLSSEVDFAGNTAVSARNFMESLFNITDPMPKTDKIAIPEYVGAMENWGLNTYSFQWLLVDQFKTRQIDQLEVCKTVCHELAHIWFGNLVTMEWWNELWLNEAMATFLENYVASKVCPQWDVVTLMVMNYRSLLMDYDSLQTARPIISPISVQSLDDMDAMFNSFVYTKGGYLMYWVMEIIGEKRFIKVISHYLKSHSFSNTKSKDFYHFLQSEFTDQITTLLNSWLRQSGYPIVKVAYNPFRKTVKVTQKHVLKNIKMLSNPSSSTSYNDKWTIALSYSSRITKNRIAWMQANHEYLTINVKEEVSISNWWLLFNGNSRGPYIVNYDSNLWNRLINALKIDHNIFTSNQRLIMLDDAFKLADWGEISISTPLDMSKYLIKEVSVEVWVVFHRQISHINSRLLNFPCYYLWLKYMKSYMSKAVSVLDNDSSTKIVTRNLKYFLKSMECKFGINDCLQNASITFHKLLNDPNFNEPDDEMYLFYGFQQNDTEENAEVLWSKFYATGKVSYLYALTGSNNPEIIFKMLDRSCTFGFGNILKIFFRASISLNLKLQWLQDLISNEDRMIRCSFFENMDTILDYISDYVHDDDALRQMQNLIENPVITSQLDNDFKTNILSKIKNNILWQDINKSTLITWLYNNV